MILENKLDPEYVDRAKKTALSKSRILYEGALKRGRIDFADAMSSVVDSIDKSNYNSIDFEILLKE